MKEEGTVKSLTHGFVSDTSIHGFNRLVRKAGLFRKIVWTTAILAGASVSVWGIVQIVISYSSWEVSTVVSLEYNYKLDFPAVTICNLNPARKTAVEKLAKSSKVLTDVLKDLNDVDNNDSAKDGGTKESLTQDGDAKDYPTQDGGTKDSPIQDGGVKDDQTDQDGMDYRLKDEEAKDYLDQDGAAKDNLGQDGGTSDFPSQDGGVKDFLTQDVWTENNENPFVEHITNFNEAMKTFTLEQRRSVGHQLKDMLEDCYFMTQSCNLSIFTQFYSYLHGNCYTFNPQTFAKAVTRPGPYYGLTLTLKVQEEEYLPQLAESVGFKVVVHNNNAMPFPEDEGFNIAPGFSTLVGVTKVVMDRAPPPYSRCRDNKEAPPPNIFINQLKNVQYSDKACDKTCFQTLVVKTCGCCDERYPCELADLKLVMPYLTKTVPFCNLEVKHSRDKCAEDLIQEFEASGIECREICLPNCYEETHQLEISSSLYPVIDRTSDLANSLIQDVVDQGFILNVNKDSSASAKELYLRRNTLHLEVFYKQLNYEKVVTRPAYTWNSLLSDVGGQAGLWLGFSLLTLGEILELLYDIVVHLVAKIHSRRTNVKPFE